MTNFEKWQLAINAFVGFGTIVVAVLAIWGDWVRHLLGGAPKLTLAIRDPLGDLIRTDHQGKSLTPQRYYHLLVANGRRWTQAQNVRVVVVEYFRLAPDGTFVRQPLSGPLQLMWQYALVNPNPLYKTVGPNEICDLGFIVKGEDFKLTPYYAPSNFDGSLSPNQRMRIVVQAIAHNAESNRLSIDIAWNGLWSEDSLEMSSNFVISQST